jgi:hypothetical protein
MEEADDFLGGVLDALDVVQDDVARQRLSLSLGRLVLLRVVQQVVR